MKSYSNKTLVLILGLLAAVVALTAWFFSLNIISAVTIVVLAVAIVAAFCNSAISFRAIPHLVMLLCIGQYLGLWLSRILSIASFPILNHVLGIPLFALFMPLTLALEKSDRIRRLLFCVMAMLGFAAMCLYMAHYPAIFYESIYSSDIFVVSIRFLFFIVGVFCCAFMVLCVWMRFKELPLLFPFVSGNAVTWLATVSSLAGVALSSDLILEAFISQLGWHTFFAAATVIAASGILFAVALTGWYCFVSTRRLPRLAFVLLIALGLAVFTEISSLVKREALTYFMNWMTT